MYFARDGMRACAIFFFYISLFSFDQLNSLNLIVAVKSKGASWDDDEEQEEEKPKGKGKAKGGKKKGNPLMQLILNNFLKHANYCCFIILRAFIIVIVISTN